jgi:hypothetical protein
MNFKPFPLLRLDPTLANRPDINELNLAYDGVLVIARMYPSSIPEADLKSLRDAMLAVRGHASYEQL